MKVNNVGLFDLTNKTPRPGTWGTLKQRQMMIENPSLEITESKVDLSYNNMDLVFYRDPTITQPEMEIKDGSIIYYKTPMAKHEEGRGKEGSRFIVSTGIIVMGYYYQTDKIQKALDYTSTHLAIGNKYFQYDKILNNILHGPYNAIINILRKRTNKDIKLINNDITINGMKICGGDEFYNATGTFQQFGITFDYDDKLFKRLLSEDEYWRKTKEGITGISNEIPYYTREEFIKELGDEILNLVKEV